MSFGGQSEMWPPNDASAARKGNEDNAPTHAPPLQGRGVEDTVTTARGEPPMITLATAIAIASTTMLASTFCTRFVWVPEFRV